MSTNTESEWLSWAEKTCPNIANWLDANEISILRLLLNLGATNNANQQKVYAKALLDADLVSVVSRINSAVEANGGYLLSNTYSTVDVRVLTLFYKLSVLFPPTSSHVTSSFPHYGKWISNLNAIPAVSSAL